MLYTESPYTFRQFWGSEGLNLAIFCSFEISGITLSEDIGEEWELTALHKLQIPTPSLPILDKTLPILSFFGDFRTSVQGRTLGIITQQLTSGWPTVAVMLPATVISEGVHKDSKVTRLQFTGLSESVVELIEKMIFRHHRRLVAGAKLSPSRPS